jgi:hypothetical protein
MTPKLLAALAAVSLAGCAALPSDVLLEQGHTSSLTQHLRATPTNYGTNTSMLFLRWRPAPRVYVDLGEGISYGASFVPSHPEVFQGRIGLDLPLPWR